MTQETRKSETTGYDERLMTMASVSERDEYLRTYPHPIPETHEFCYRWQDDMHLLIGVRLKSDPKARETHKAVTDLSSLSLAELETRAAELGIDMPKGGTKRDIATLIREHEKAGAMPVVAAAKAAK